VSSSEIDTSVSAPEDELVSAELDEARRKRSTGRARMVGTLVSVAVIGAVFAFALPRIADYGDVWDGTMKKIFEGSVSQQVAEHASRPVLIVPAPR
jgi:hypothetical protein